MDRDHGFRIRFTADERAMLRELAGAQGLSSADVLRLFIRRQHAQMIGEKMLRGGPNASVRSQER